MMSIAVASALAIGCVAVLFGMVMERAGRRRDIRARRSAARTRGG